MAADANCERQNRRTEKGSCYDGSNLEAAEPEQDEVPGQHDIHQTIDECSNPSRDDEYLCIGACLRR